MPELHASEYPDFTRRRMAASADGPQVFAVRKDDKGRAVVHTLIEKASTIDLSVPYSEINFYDLRHILNRLQRNRQVKFRAMFFGAHDAFDIDVVAAFAKAAGRQADIRYGTVLDCEMAEAIIVNKCHVLGFSQGILMAVFNEPETAQKFNAHFATSWSGGRPEPLRL